MKRKIPFGWWPGSWGLSGLTREIAKAEYELEGEELERKLAELKIEPGTFDYHKKILELDLKYSKISEEEFDRKYAELTMGVDSLGYRRKSLELDLKYSKITPVEYEKQIHSLENKPWFKIMDVTYHNTHNGGRFAFEYDWNEQHLEDLKSQGYSGPTDEDIIEQWLNDCARQIIPSISDSVEDDPPPTRKIQKTKKTGGKTEYS
jgi:chromosome segregation ATPase